MSEDNQDKKAVLNTDCVPDTQISESAPESNVNAKAAFNLREIEVGVSKLSVTKSVIKDSLSPQVYKDVVETIDGTIESLNEIDDLIPYKQQIQNQIIKPVNDKIKKSSAIGLVVSIIFGIVGVISILLSIIETQKNEQILSKAIAVKDSTIDLQASKVTNIKDETTALIYPEDVKLTVSIISKYLDCKEIINSLIFVEQQKNILSPFIRSDRLKFARPTFQPRGIRTPPKTIVIHPYQLEETAKILSAHFRFAEIKEILGDCQ